MSEIQRDLGIHSKAIDNLEREVKEIKEAVDEIKTMLNQTKGGIRMLLAVAAVAGAMGAGIAKFFLFFKGN